MPMVSPTLSRRYFRPYPVHSIGSIPLLVNFTIVTIPPSFSTPPDLTISPSSSTQLGVTTALHRVSPSYFITSSVLSSLSTSLYRQYLRTHGRYLRFASFSRRNAAVSMRVSQVTFYMAQEYLVFIYTE